MVKRIFKLEMDIPFVGTPEETIDYVYTTVKQRAIGEILDQQMAAIVNAGGAGLDPKTEAYVAVLHRDKDAVTSIQISLHEDDVDPKPQKKLNVVTLEDFENIPAGSCIQNVETVEETYVGIFTSYFGSWSVTIPIRICKIQPE